MHSTLLVSLFHAGVAGIVMVLSLALIIVIHEAGHWLVARILGFQTPVFSIGFGKRQHSLILGTFWQTEFRIAPIPLGGFVSLPEMQDETTARELMKKSGNEDKPVRVFPVWKRIAVALAGVTFNLISAAVILFALFAFAGEPGNQIDSTAVASFSKSVTIAHDAGFQVGDKFVTADGKKIVSGDDLVAVLGSHKGTPVTVVVERSGSNVSIDVTPDARGAIGIGLNMTAHQVFVPTSTGKAASDAVSTTQYLLKETARGFGMMLHIVPKPAELPAEALEVHSIIGIVQMGGAAFLMGFYNFVWFLVVISLNLVIFNVLPLPMLDGGHVMFFLWEKVSGKPVNARVKGIMYRVVLVLLLSVVAIGSYNDVRALAHAAQNLR